MNMDRPTINASCHEEALREYNESIFFNKLCLVASGLWPIEPDASAKQIRWRRIHQSLMYLSAVVLIIPEWIDMCYLFGKISPFFETLISNAFTLTIAIKYASFNFRKDVFEDVLEIMQSKWIEIMLRPNSEKNKRILRESSVRARRFGFCYISAICVAGTFFSIMPLINSQKPEHRDRQYPYFGRYIIDRDSDLIYVICYMSQMIAMAPIVVMTYAMDGIFIMTTYQFCAQLRILQNDLMELGKNGSNTRQDVIHLIKRHQEAIRYSQALQKVFSISGQQQLIACGLGICINGFNLIITLTAGNLSCLIFIACIPVYFFQILSVCQPGNEIIVHSQAIAVAIQQSSWNELDQVSVRHLSLMIRRSQKPLTIVVAKIYQLSLENFMR
ncbi:hypothetical protein QAD02_022303, partial [Eretmocerus hayati]